MSNRLFYTTTDVAKRLKISSRWLRELCARHEIGTKVTERLRLLGSHDVESVRQILSRKNQRRKGD